MINVINYLLLYILRKLDGDRSPAAAFYILTGRKSSQIVQDITLFNLQPFFNTLPNYERIDFNQDITFLVSKGYLEVLNEKVMRITKEGIVYLDHHEMASFFNVFTVSNSNRDRQIFTARLYLTIQTFTYRVMRKKGFMPVEEDVTIQAFVKQIYKRYNHQLSDWLEDCYRFLHEVLEQYPDNMRHIYLDRLSTYSGSGASLQQLKVQYDMTVSDILLILAVIETHLMKLSIENQTILTELLPRAVNQTAIERFMTRSAVKTYQLVKKGYTLEELVAARQLKRGTIEDHLVEICILDPEFRIDSYVDPLTIKKVMRVISELNTHKLTLIKKALPEDIPYFHVRLVLVKSKERLTL